MKRFILTAVLGCLISGAAMAQKAKVVNIATPTVQCEMCKTRIEQYLKRVDGVTFVNVKYKAKQTQVKYLSDRTDEEIIKASIANAGYDAGEIAANSDSYKLLPKCCKKPEDGGGMKKK
ncbi:MAG TPA: cation transporter [Flavisolibacter sp.]|nr:cation transporter [Flavisolibacter sp.]